MTWLGSVTVRLGRWTCDREVVGPTPGQVAIKWLVPGWVTVCGQVNHLKVNSAFHHSGVGKLSTGLLGLGYSGPRTPVSGGM